MPATCIEMADPMMLNPNSHSSVQRVLEHIVNDTTGLDSRTAIGCDGNPYLIATKLICSTFYCESCKSVVQCSQKEFNRHLLTHNSDLSENYDVTKHLHFGNVMMITGAGHFEMNMLRGLMKLGWTIYYKEVARLLGFKSEKAMMFARSCGDHHQAWEIFNIVFRANMSELLIPYIRECISKQQEPSVAKYMDWYSTISS